jgi:Bacterial pre-peptidase C-terminal domain
MPARSVGGAWGCILCCGLVLLGAANTPPKEFRLQQPAVRALFPLGGKAGRPVKVEIEGEFLDRASAIRCDCSDVTAVIRHAGALTVDVDLTVAESAEPGLRVMYVESPRGTSNRFFFRVTRWESVRESEPNDRLDQAQVVTTPVVIEGRVARLTDVDFFRFHANAGERLAFNVMTARTNAPGYVSIALLDPNGRELARKHSGVGPDPYMQYRFEEAGDYFIAVYPRRFSDFFTVVKDDQLINWQYQLAIGRSPMLWSVFPSGAPRGKTTDVEIHADFLDGGAKPVFSGKGVSAEPIESTKDGKFLMKVHVAEDAELGMHLLRFPDDSGNLGALGFAVSDGPEVLASGKSPQTVMPPVTVNGRIRSPGEHDAYRFKVNSDDAMTFHVDAVTLGSQMSDPQVALLRADGDFSDWADERCKTCAGFYETVLKKELLDPQLTHAFISRSVNDADAAGDYDIVILDNSSRGSEDLTYRLTIRPPQPGFRAGVMVDHLNAEEGGVAWIPVAIAREEGFKKDVEITAEGLPAGWTVKPLRISGGEDTGKLEVSGHGCAPLHLIARAEVGEKQLVEPVLAPPISTQDGAGYLELPRQTVEVAFVQKHQIALTVEPPPAGFVIDRSKSSEVQLQCKIERCPQCAAPEAPLKFDVDGMPPGMRLVRQESAADGASETVTLAAEVKAVEPGQYRLALFARGRVDGREIYEATPAISIRVK